MLVTISFLTQYYNGKEKKDLDTRYTTHITRTSRVWQAIGCADLFSTSYSRKMASGSLFFRKSGAAVTPSNNQSTVLLPKSTIHPSTCTEFLFFYIFLFWYTCSASYRYYLMLMYTCISRGVFLSTKYNLQILLVLFLINR